MHWDAVSDINYILINVYFHGTLRCLKRKGKIVWALFHNYIYFALVFCFWE